MVDSVLVWISKNFGLLGAFFSLSVILNIFLYKENRGLSKELRDSSAMRATEVKEMLEKYYTLQQILKNDYNSQGEALKNVGSNTLEIVKGLKEVLIKSTKA